MECLKTDIMPSNVRIFTKRKRKLMIYLDVAFGFIAVLAWFVGITKDLKSWIILTGMLLMIVTPWLVREFFLEKTILSTVHFADDKIQIRNQKGKCWREINYNIITDMRSEVIADYFYGGENRLSFRNKYICLYLNGAKSIPNVPFAKLFKEKNFFMFNYNDEALYFLEKKIGIQSAQSGDGSMIDG